MNKIQKAIMHSAIGQYFVLILNFTSVIILARIMTPAEIGVFAVAGAVSLLAIELRSMGVAQYLIREKDLNKNKIRTALGLTVSVSWGLGFIIAIAAPFVADFYEEPAIKNILWILCISFVIGPYTSVPIALLTRNMQFHLLLIHKVITAISQFSSTIIFVLLGYSYYGLALGSTVGSIMAFIIVIYMRPAGNVLIPSISWKGKLIKFGLYTSSNSLFVRFSESVPDLVIGRLATMSDVGIFSRGLGVILFMNKLILSAVAPVILPHFSQVQREGKSVAEAYLKAVKLQVAFSWPVFAVAGVAALPMIRALFGDQWDLAVPIASILTLWAILTAVHCFSSQALIATGGESLVFITGLIILIVRFVGVLVAAPYGLEVIAWSIVASGVVELIIKTWAIKKSTGLSVRCLVVELIPNMMITIVCLLATILIDQLMPFEETNHWNSISVIFVCLLATWLFLLRITKHEAWDIVIGLFNRVAQKKQMPGS